MVDLISASGAGSFGDPDSATEGNTVVLWSSDLGDSFTISRVIQGTENVGIGGTRILSFDGISNGAFQAKIVVQGSDSASEQFQDVVDYVNGTSPTVAHSKDDNANGRTYSYDNSDNGYLTLAMSSGGARVWASAVIARVYI